MLTNPKWEAFAVAYAEHGNGTRAAVEAGFSPGAGNAGAAVRSSQLLKKPEVKKRIEELRQRLKRKQLASTSVDRAWVLERLKDNAEQALERGDRAAANRALELLGREHGLFVERKQILYGPLDALGAHELQRLLHLAQALEEGRLALPSSQVTNRGENTSDTDIIELSPGDGYRPVPGDLVEGVEEDSSPVEEEDVDPLS